MCANPLGLGSKWSVSFRKDLNTVPGNLLCPEHPDHIKSSTMKTFVLILVFFSVGCKHTLPPEDYKIEQTYKKCDQNNNCKLITEQVK